VNVHHGDEAGKTKNGGMLSPSWRAKCRSDFYDTSTGTATRAARCGSLLERAKIALSVGYVGTRWT
jgi:hypothetical protein